jgi:phosphate starvation-inducible PhoH-like protein
MKKTIEITPNIEPIFGTRDENLHLIENTLKVRIDLRSDALYLEGEPEVIARVEQIFADYEALRRAGVTLQNGELNGMLKLVVADKSVTLRSLVDSGKQRSTGIRRMVQPRSVNQRQYLEAIERSDMVFGIGPAGTGKTYLAVAMAVAALTAKKSFAAGAGASRGRSGRTAWISAGHAAGKSRSIFAAALRRAL